MHGYIDRLLRCGYGIEDAYNIVEEYVSAYKWKELEDFVSAEESAAKLKGAYYVQSSTVQ